MTVSPENSKSSLSQELHPLIGQLAEVITDHWEKFLQLSPYVLPEEFSYVEGSLEGEKLRIKNHCYQSPQFRKLHLELAQVGTNLDILHCVMFPRPEYDLPMFGCDIVAGKGKVSAAIADLSPVNPEKVLSSPYRKALENLTYIGFKTPRKLPEWADIFSDFCLFVRPHNPEEEMLFLSRTSDFLTIHCELAQNSQPVSSRQQTLFLEGQRYYCQQQQRNDKTRRVLEKAFGVKWAANYMTSVLFDIP